MSTMKHIQDKVDEYATARSQYDRAYIELTALATAREDAFAVIEKALSREYQSMDTVPKDGSQVQFIAADGKAWIAKWFNHAPIISGEGWMQPDGEFAHDTERRAVGWLPIAPRRRFTVEVINTMRRASGMVDSGDPGGPRGWAHYCVDCGYGVGEHYAADCPHCHKEPGMFRAPE